MVSQHRCREASSHYLITWASVDPDLCHHMASLGHSQLIFMSSMRLSNIRVRYGSLHSNYLSPSWTLYLQLTSSIDGGFAPCALSQYKVFTGIGNHMLKIRQSRDRLICSMGIPLLVKCKLYIEKIPWLYFIFVEWANVLHGPVCAYIVIHHRILNKYRLFYISV